MLTDVLCIKVEINFHLQLISRMTDMRNFTRLGMLECVCRYRLKRNMVTTVRRSIWNNRRALACGGFLRLFGENQRHGICILSCAERVPGDGDGRFKANEALLHEAQLTLRRFHNVKTWSRSRLPDLLTISLSQISFHSATRRCY